MLPAFKGRINRKTFILGNAVAWGILGFIALIYIVPIAVIDIIVKGSDNAPWLFKGLYSLYLAPMVFYFFFFAILFVRRMHDIGFPGMLILWSFIAIEALARLTDIGILNVLGFVLLLGVCALPGQKTRNNFGPKPSKRFKLQDLIVKL